jgi:hypothetical protein
MLRLRTIVLMWLARRAWKLARSLYQRRQARHVRAQPSIADG